MKHSWVLLLVGAFLLTSPAPAAPFAVTGPNVRPDDFEITIFAQGLNFPKGMQALADGSLLVATSDPNPGSKSFYSSKGTLIRLEDSDRDGVADGPPSVLFSGLPGSLSGLRVAGSLIFVVSTGKRISVLRAGPTPSAPLTLLGSITISLPSGWEHPPSDLAVREAPGEPGSYDIFFQLGSEENFAPSRRTATVGGDLGVSGAIQGDSIYQVTILDHGDGVSASGLRRIATGLRNPAGFAFDPATGDLYFEDNGIDGLADPNEPLSADELNSIPAAAIGGEAEDFGFPGSYVEYRTGDLIGGEGAQPLAAFQPLPNPRTGDESEGPSEIAFAPPAFPDGLNKGLFVGFHGKFNLKGLSNEENPLVYVDLATREYFHFVANNEPGIGHLDGLLAIEDSLFLSDIASQGSMNDGGGSGVIYRVRASGQPPREIFIRGDSNRDEAVNLSDCFRVLEPLFQMGEALPCPDAADANDDGEVDIADAVAILFSLFVGWRMPPPFPGSGVDPTPDELRCPP
jgi:glucose/arabinose dehydrogenase